MHDVHEHSHPHDHGHHHGHDHALPVIEEPLDPANQSLADALRLSFKLLKVVMLCLIVAFLASGVVMVDESEVVVLSRLGRIVGDPLQPGVHFALPYPIDEQTRVSTTLRQLPIEAFWIRLSDADKDKPLSEVAARSGGLNPKTDGALLTGDRALMHLRLDVQYRVQDAVRTRADREQPEERLSDVLLFVLNVGPEHEEKLLKTVMQNAAVAEAARTPADVVWLEPNTIASRIRTRAQAELDRLETGIVLETVQGAGYYPLQAREEFLSVSRAENRRRELIKEAEAERTKTLLGMAGEAWEPLTELIQQLDQVEADPTGRETLIEQIESLLTRSATGTAGGIIKFAQRDREAFIAEVLAEVERFNAYRQEYQAGPELVRKQLRLALQKALYASPGVVKWWLPPGDKQVILTLNKDPKEVRDEEQRRLKEAAEKR